MLISVQGSLTQRFGEYLVANLTKYEDSNHLDSAYNE